MPASPRSILIVKTTSLGDVAHALPAAVRLRERFPAARIAWLVDRRYADLLAGHRAIDEIIAAPSSDWGSATRWQPFVRGWGNFAIAPSLRSRRFDWAIDFQGLFRTAAATVLCGARRRIGFADAREGANELYTDTVEAGDRAVHPVIRNLRLALRCGHVASTEATLSFHSALAPAAWARDEATRLTDGAGAYVAIAPFTSSPDKNWPTERFVELVDLLHRSGLSVVLLGSTADRAACEWMRERAAEPTVNAAGCRLAVSMALMAGAAATVGCDSGPLHVAAAMGGPTVGIYGPTDPRRLGPWGKPSRCVRGPLSELRADTVMRAVQRALAGPRTVDAPEPEELS